MKFGLEAKVGVFVIGCLLLLGGMATKLTGMNFGQTDTYTITSYVENAAGLTKDAKVMFRGVDIGKVIDISLESGQVKLLLELDNQYQIPENISVSVKASGFLGSMHLELIQTEETASGALTENAVVNSYQKTTDINELSNKLGDIADDIKAITSSLKTVLATDVGKQQMKGTLENVHDSTRVLREMMVENQQRINQIVKNVETLTGSMSSITAGNQQNINELIANLKDVSDVLKKQTPEIADKVNNISGNVDELVTDSKDDLKETFSNVRTVTAKLEKTVDNLNDITGKIKNGEGTVGKLVNDNETIDNINSTIKKLDKMLTGFDEWKIYLEFSGEYLAETDNTKGRFNVKLQPREDKYYLAGVNLTANGRSRKTNTTKTQNCEYGCTSFSYSEEKVEQYPDEMTFNLLYVKRFYDQLDLKIGLIESDFGVGVEYFPFEDKKLSLSADAFDFQSNDGEEDTHLRAKVEYRIFDSIYVNAGYDDPLSEENRSYFLGGGLIFLDEDLKLLIGNVPLP